MSTEVIVTKLPNCDLCQNTASYDAKTKMGPWAYLCEQCFSFYGPARLGTGLGQKLILKET